MRDILACSHSVAEGAYAAAFAAVIQEHERLVGQTVGLALSVGNVDSAMLAEVLLKQSTPTQY